MDFIGPISESNGFNSIMVVVDRFSKMIKAIPCKHTYNAKQIASLYLHRVLSDHGVPKTIISDRGSIFLSEFWKEFFAALQTKLKYSTAYHPQSDW